MTITRTATGLVLSRRRPRQVLLSITAPSFDGDILPGPNDSLRVVEGSVLSIDPPEYNIPIGSLRLWYKVERWSGDVRVSAGTYSEDPAYTVPEGILGQELQPVVKAEDRAGIIDGAIKQEIETSGRRVLILGDTTPANTARPTLSGHTAGEVEVPGVLTYVTSPAASTRWTGDFTTINRNWQRNGADIAGATGTSYATSAGDDGRQIRIREWPDDDESLSVFSDPVLVTFVGVVDPSGLSNANWGMIEVVDGNGQRLMQYGTSRPGGAAIIPPGDWTYVSLASTIFPIPLGNAGVALDVDGSGERLFTTELPAGQVVYHTIVAQYNPDPSRRVYVGSQALTATIAGEAGLFPWGTVKLTHPVTPPVDPDPPTAVISAADYGVTEFWSTSGAGRATVFVGAHWEGGSTVELEAGYKYFIYHTSMPGGNIEASGITEITAGDFTRTYGNTFPVGTIIETGIYRQVGDDILTREIVTPQDTDLVTINGVEYPYGSYIAKEAAADPTPATVTPTAPVVTTQPTITGGGGGVAQIGAELIINPGAASGLPAPTARYRVYRNGMPIDGAIFPNYTVGAADLASTLTARISWANRHSPDGVLSNPTAGLLVATNNPPPDPDPDPTPSAIGMPSDDLKAVARAAQLFRCTDGNATNYSYAGNALQALAISVLKGDTGATRARLIEQFDYMCDGARCPPMGGGYTENDNIMVTQMFAPIRWSDLWNNNTLWGADRRVKAELIVRAGLLSGAFVVSGKNPWGAAGSKPRSLRGGDAQHMWHAGPNFSFQPSGQVLSAAAFYGSMSAAMNVLNNLDMVAYRAQLQAHGLTNIWRTMNWRNLGIGGSTTTWNPASSKAPTDEQIEAAVANLTYQDTGISFNNHLRILAAVTHPIGVADRSMFSGLIHRGRNNGAGSVNSPDAPDGQPRCGRQPVGTPNPPNMGMTGGADEIYLANDGAERSSMGYAMLGVRSCFGTWLCLQAAGMLDRTHPDIAAAIPVMHRGMLDLLHKDGTRYFNWSGSGTMRGTWPYEPSWGRHRSGQPTQGAQGGYLFGLYFQCLAPALGL